MEEGNLLNAEAPSCSYISDRISNGSIVDMDLRGFYKGGEKWWGVDAALSSCGSYFIDFKRL
jgi:hypothetical protein